LDIIKKILLLEIYVSLSFYILLHLQIICISALRTVRLISLLVSIRFNDYYRASFAAIVLSRRI